MKSNSGCLAWQFSIFISWAMLSAQSYSFHYCCCLFCDRVSLLTLAVPNTDSNSQRSAWLCLLDWKSLCLAYLFLRLLLWRHGWPATHYIYYANLELSKNLALVFLVFWSMLHHSQIKVQTFADAFKAWLTQCMCLPLYLLPIVHVRPTFSQQTPCPLSWPMLLAFLLPIQP